MTSPVTAWARAVLALILLIGAVACSGEWITVKGDPPLDRIVLSPSGEAAVHALPTVDLQELVSLETFLEMGLQPGMTAGEAESLLGIPDYVAVENNGRDEIFGYRVASGVVEIVKQQVSSEGSEVDRWFVRSQPERCMEQIDPRIVQQLRALERFPRAMRVVGGAAKGSLVSVYFEDDETCSEIWWLAENAGSNALDGE